MTEASTCAPAASRIADLDALRGFALLGILAVNINAFASAYFGTGIHDPAFDGLADQLTRWVSVTLFESKFYLLFSFLFGYSFTLQMASAANGASAFVPRFLRRLGGLAVLGALHGLLLFHGDILLPYALLGLVLLGLRDLKPRNAVRAAVVLVLVSALALAVMAALSSLYPAGLPVAAIHTQAQQATEAYRQGVAGTVRQHFNELRDGVLIALLFIQGPSSLAMFLLGLAAGKSASLVRLAGDSGRLRRMVAVCMPVGLAGAVAYSHLSLQFAAESKVLWALTIDVVTAPFLSASYLALLLLALHRPMWGARLGEWLAPAGRAALSNYLLQSLICAVLFTGYGFGLIGRVSPPVVLAMVPLIYGSQLLLSRWWMRRHAYGPVEWLLRALTYWRWPAWGVGRGLLPVPRSDSALNRR
jgi:uncharacterized protein